MKTLNYTIKIKAPREVVWKKMIAPDSYQIWTKAFSEHVSLYEGDWKEGTEIKFFSPGRGGTVAYLEKVTPFEEIRAKHVGMIDPEDNIIRSGEGVAHWLGTKEEYYFSEDQGVTTLKVRMEVYPDFIEMFEESWPRALESLKKLVET